MCLRVHGGRARFRSAMARRSLTTGAGRPRQPGRRAVVAALLVAACHHPPRSAPDRAMLRDPDAPGWRERAPDSVRIRFETSRGPFVVALYRPNAPIGVDHLYNLVRAGFYDDSRVFRVVPGYIVQFGVAGVPAANAIWNARAIADDPERERNTRGTLAFSMRGPNDRRTQVYVNLVDNARNDGQGFAILGRVVAGMTVVDSLYGGYGEGAVGGMRAGRQTQALTEGNAYLDRAFPRMDRIVRAVVLR